MIAEIGGIRYAPAESAKLRHRETTGLITADATVTVTGELGSASIGVTTGQTLAEVAASINAQQDSTGIVARVDDVDLVLESRPTGATSQAEIEVTAGSFDTVEDYTAATAAELTYTGTDGKLVGDVSFDLTGTGTDNYSFTDGDSLASIRDTINLDSGATGVEASVNGDQLILRSTATGSTASIAVTNVVGTFDLTGGNGDGTADGTNATAASTGEDATTPHATLRGNQLTVSRNGTHFEIEFAAGFSGEFNTMTIGEGGLSFALSTDLHYQSDLSIPSLEASQLGGISGNLTDLLTGGSASGLGNNTSEALRIVEEALGRVDMVDGTVDGFYNSSVTTSKRPLGRSADRPRRRHLLHRWLQRGGRKRPSRQKSGACLKCLGRIGDNDSAATGNHRPDQTSGGTSHLAPPQEPAFPLWAVTGACLSPPPSYPPRLTGPPTLFKLAGLRSGDTASTLTTAFQRSLWFDGTKGSDFLSIGPFAGPGLPSDSALTSVAIH